MSDSAHPVFIVACKAHGVKKPNPKLVKFFQQDEPVMEDIEDIDLSGNYVGNRGILALCDVIEKLPNFRSLNLSGQKLYNTDLSEDSVKGNSVMDRVVDVLKGHPSVTALDVSANPVSNYVGRKLLGLAQLNPRMCKIAVEDTRIDFDLRKRISSQCEKNTTALWDAQEAEPADEHGEDSGFGAFSPGGFDPAAHKAPDLSSLGGGRHRKTIHAEGIDPEKAKHYKAPVHEKSSEDIDMIVNLLAQNVLFSFLGSREMRTVALAMFRKDFARGDDILTQNGIGDALYVLQNGSCDILKEGQKVFLKTPGTAVGELELMYDSPCAATVRVCSDSLITWVLDRDTYRNLVMGTAIRRREEYAAHVAKIPLFETLSHYEKMQVADALSSDEFNKGDYIIRFDEEGEWMYVILEGDVEVIGRSNGEPKHVCDFTAGDYIGELEFLNNHRTVADVLAKGFVRTAKLNRRHFEMCLGPVKDVLKRNATNPKYQHYQQVLEESEKKQSASKEASVNVPPQEARKSAE
jgi:CRP-like cAMP-binding protein